MFREVIDKGNITDFDDPLNDSPSRNVKMVLGDIFNQKALDANIAVVDVYPVDEEGKSFNNEEFEESASGVLFKMGRHKYDLNFQ